MTEAGEQFEAGEYEAGDINLVEGARPDAPVDEHYEAGDVNTVAGRAEPSVGDAGNQAGSGTSVSVLGYLARSLSNDPEAVVIQREDRNGTLRLRLHVAPEDMGRVIGRRGRTAQAIRTLVGVAGARDGVQATVDIVDD